MAAAAAVAVVAAVVDESTCDVVPRHDDSMADVFDAAEVVDLMTCGGDAAAVAAVVVVALVALVACVALAHCLFESSWSMNPNPVAVVGWVEDCEKNDEKS